MAPRVKEALHNKQARHILSMFDTSGGSRQSSRAFVVDSVRISLRVSMTESFRGHGYNEQSKTRNEMRTVRH